MVDAFAVPLPAVPAACVSAAAWFAAAVVSGVTAWAPLSLW